MNKKSKILPVILRSGGRPNKEVIIGRGKHGGYDLHISFAKFRDGIECGQRLEDGDCEREGHLCWIHFTDLRAMELFARTIMAAWESFATKERSDE